MKKWTTKLVHVRLKTPLALTLNSNSKLIWMEEDTFNFFNFTQKAFGAHQPDNKQQQINIIVDNW